MTSPHFEAAARARAARQLLKQATASLTGRPRGKDPTVRRLSYDVDDDRAKPWVRLGDGSIGAGIAHREAIVQTARELSHQQWREMPGASIRDLRAEMAAIDGDLAALASRAPADVPVGLPAKLRMRRSEIAAELARFDQRIRRIDVTILDALLAHINYATGQLFPRLDTIAAAAACHRNSVIAALRRLKHHGFVTWVRRSVTTGRDREFAPQREQTSNAYACDPSRRLQGGVRARFLQVLASKLRRLGRRPSTAPDGAGEPRAPRDPGLASALAALGASVANAST